MKITEEQFINCLVKLEGVGIDKDSAEHIASQLAKLRDDGKIDAISFMDYMADEERDPLNVLKDVVYLNG